MTGSPRKTLPSGQEKASHDDTDPSLPITTGPGAAAGPRTTLRLSQLLKRPVADHSGEPIGRVSDIIVRLRGTDYPLVTGLVAAVGGGRSSRPSTR